MRLSRLSNRQLRRLLARGEVRFAWPNEEQEKRLNAAFKIRDLFDNIANNLQNIQTPIKNQIRYIAEDGGQLARLVGNKYPRREIDDVLKTYDVLMRKAKIAQGIIDKAKREAIRAMDLGEFEHIVLR